MRIPSITAISILFIFQATSAVQAGTITNQVHRIDIKNPTFRTIKLTSPQQTNIAGNTQAVLDYFIAHDAKKYYITGIPLTIQCRNFNNDTPMTFNSGLQGNNSSQVENDSLWQIGSNSKSFLSVVILQLEAEGKLSITDKVSKYIPQNPYPKWNNITIKQLLNMTSGIHDYLNDETAIPNRVAQNPYYFFTKDELLDSVKELDLWFTPGTKWKYSNTNYVLAGKIVEFITGHSVSEEINARIIKPLNLKHTYYITHIPKENVLPQDKKYLMSGYFGLKDAFPIPVGSDIIDYSVSSGQVAGSITASSADLNQYVHALFAGKLLPKKQFEELIELVDENANPLPNGVDKDHKEGYGLGIQATYSPELNSVVYSHGGGTLGFISSWRYIVSTKSSIVFSINTNIVMDEPIIKFFGSLFDSLPDSCLN